MNNMQKCFSCNYQQTVEFSRSKEIFVKVTDGTSLMSDSLNPKMVQEPAHKKSKSNGEKKIMDYFRIEQE